MVRRTARFAECSTGGVRQTSNRYELVWRPGTKDDAAPKAAPPLDVLEDADDPRQLALSNHNVWEGKTIPRAPRASASAMPSAEASEPSVCTQPHESALVSVFGSASAVPNQATAEPEVPLCDLAPELDAAPEEAGAVALVLSVLACYGTLVATAALSLAGITLAVNPGAVSATILGFAALVLAAIGAGVRKHGRPAPLAPALAGGAVLLYAHLVEFSFAVELAGFFALGLAVALDLRARRRFEA